MEGWMDGVGLKSFGGYEGGIKRMGLWDVNS